MSLQKELEIFAEMTGESVKEYIHFRTLFVNVQFIVILFVLYFIYNSINKTPELKPQIKNNQTTIKKSEVKETKSIGVFDIENSTYISTRYRKDGMHLTFMIEGKKINQYYTMIIKGKKDDFKSNQKNR